MLNRHMAHSSASRPSAWPCTPHSVRAGRSPSSPHSVRAGRSPDAEDAEDAEEDGKVQEQNLEEKSRAVSTDVAESATEGADAGSKGLKAGQKKVDQVDPVVGVALTLFNGEIVDETEVVK